MSSELDPLKDLAAIYEPDSRQASFLYPLEDRHADLAEMVLTPVVPSSVRQLFETAKNVALYSWFVYRFHQVAEMVAFSALELALRLRAGLRESDYAQLPDLLKRARREGWLRNDRFPIRLSMAKSKAFGRVLERNIGRSIESIPEPTQDEVDAALAETDVVQLVVELTPKLRNRLAHGSSILHPNSFSTLRVVYEAIDQLFPTTDDKAG